MCNNAFYFSVSAIYIISRGLVTLNDYCMYYLNKQKSNEKYISLYIRTDLCWLYHGVTSYVSIKLENNLH